jgi:hypothetical protein
MWKPHADTRDNGADGRKDPGLADVASAEVEMISKKIASEGADVTSECITLG